ncbi:MAG: hypothetical protein O2856_08365 [Planctomycetota bacterium]|nr:hypothetical protein [Planctomycetota bacterium]
MFNLNAIGVSGVPMPENSHDQILCECVIASRVRYSSLGQPEKGGKKFAANFRRAVRRLPVARFILTMPISSFSAGPSSRPDTFENTLKE